MVLFDTIHKRDIPKTQLLILKYTIDGQYFIISPRHNRMKRTSVINAMNRLLYSLVALLTWMIPGGGQSYYLADVTFIEEGIVLLNAMAGGLRTPQFSTVDLNLDGIDDLVVFEREGKIALPFLSDPDDASIKSYSPQFKNIFPPVENWMLLRDFNDDGIKDIFCSPTQAAIPGIEVWQGYIEDGLLNYRIVPFPDRDFDILYVPIGNGQSQIFVSVVDLPEIRDLDQDGDLDILAFEPSGTTVFLYKNMRVERNLSDETFEFTLADPCYGKFLESGFSQEVILSTDPGQCASFLTDPVVQLRHAGSTVTSVDVNEDGLMDLLIGDISYNGLVFLVNGGTIDNAWMVQSVPSYAPDGAEAVSIELFNAAFLENIDRTPEQELIVAPNDRIASQNINHIWKYVKSDETPGSYELVDKNFLVGTMVHTGGHSSPCFLDYNDDGLMDLVIGTGGLSPDGITRNPGLLLYENRGSASHAEFHLVNDDYLGMRAFSSASRYFSPAFGDIDGDDDIDAVIGDDTGRLYYLENLSGTAVLDYDVPVYGAFGIKVSAWARPDIFDFNNDGLGDLVIGEQNFNSIDGQRGSVNYFQNVGTLGSADFIADIEASPNNGLFGQINTKEQGFVNNFSAPRLFESQEKVLTAVGTESGRIHLFEAHSDNSRDSMKRVTDFLGEIREGNLVAVDLDDIDDDALYEIVVGTRRGGVAVYDTDLAFRSSVAVENTTMSIPPKIYPNPAGTSTKILHFDGIKTPEMTVRFSNVDGKSVFERVINNDTIDVTDIPSGIYVITGRMNGRMYNVLWMKI